MGKTKIRTIGNEGLEEKEKKVSKQKAYEKKLVKSDKNAEKTTSVKSESAPAEAVKLQKDQEQEQKAAVNKEKSKKSAKKTRKASRSALYQKALVNIDKNKKYKLTEALTILEKIKKTKFDETVELHINTLSVSTFGNVTLPHGTGKEIRIAIADDDLLAKVSQGKVEFDILLASPDMMPKLARVAKILGPKGLMPNPKNATLVKDPKKAAEEFKKGQIRLKTESKDPIMHLIAGKISFGPKKLTENITALIEAIGKDKIKDVTLKSTMSPGIKLEA